MMSRAQFWILLVGVNAALWLFLLRDGSGPRLAPADALATVTNVTITARAVPSVVVRTNTFDWRQLESEDYRTYINRLRTIGCPEETIRDIVIADLEKLMAPEVQQAEGRREPQKYWEPRKRERTIDTLEKLGQKQEIDFKKREIVRELLGIDLAAERSRVKGESDLYQERLGFLEPEKQMRVRMAIEKANRDEQVLREKSWLENDELTAEEKQELRSIQQRKEQEVAQTLSPAEYEQYQLWFSSSAYKVRDVFQVLEPNESDFLALFQIQKAFDDRWEGVDPASLTGDERRQYQQALNQYNDAIRERLGPERYQEFLQTREPDFQQMQDTISQFGLKPEIAAQVYGFKKALVDERARVSASNLLDDPQKQEVLKALNEETEQAVVEAMGPKAYRYFVRSGAGKWISQ
jgi:hypothetical protein